MRRRSKRDLQLHLTANPTPAESLLFNLLNDDWLFQPIIHGFIADFAHPESRLIIECDGYHHFTRAGRKADARRTAILRSKGWRIIRFSNSEIMRDTERVLAKIAKHCNL